MHPLKWLQDITAPFYLFLRMRFESTVRQDENNLNTGSISFRSRLVQEFFWVKKNRIEATVQIEDGRLKSFTFKSEKQNIQAICSY